VTLHVHGVNKCHCKLFVFLSAVCLIYFQVTDLLSSPLTQALSSFSGSEVLIFGTSLNHWHNNKCFWESRSNMGVFYRQYKHQLVSCATGKRRQLDPLRRWAGPVSRWTPFAHRKSKRFESADFLVRSDSVCSICQRLTESISIAYRFIRRSNSL
jgi:hypothetical protein